MLISDFVISTGILSFMENVRSLATTDRVFCFGKQFKIISLIFLTQDSSDEFRNGGKSDRPLCNDPRFCSLRVRVAARESDS